MSGDQMRIDFLNDEYIPHIKSDLQNIRQLTPAGIIKKCEEYGVDVVGVVGTEVLRNRLSNKMKQKKHEAHNEIADTIEEEL